MINNRIIRLLLPTIILSLLLAQIGTAVKFTKAEGSMQDLAVTPEQNAISLGLAWLAKQQDPATGAWSLSYYPVAATAFAIIKFATYKSETGDATYDSNVTAGLQYLLNSTSSFQVNITADLIANPAHWTGPGIPNTNGDGMGIYFRSIVGTSDTLGSHTSTYETAIVMMALQAADKSGYINRNALVPAGSDPDLVGRTYYVIMGDMVNFYAWAQNDASSGTARGGWRYIPNEEDPVGWSGTSDNSVSQWPVLGLITAEDWGILAPSWVRSELRDYWLAYSQNYPGSGGFIYSEGSGPSLAMTAAGLIELTYCGVPTTDPRWDAARSYIGNNWDGIGTWNIGNLYAMYAVMKAAMIAQPGVVWTFGNHTWQEEYDDYLVNVSQVNPPGYFTVPSIGNRDTAPNLILATEWALLILEKVAPPPLHSFKESLEDLLDRQAEGILSFEDLLGLLPPMNRTSELFESLENLTREQEVLLRTFEGMINASSLSQDEFISLLNSTENLLHKQYDIKERFVDMLNESMPYLPNFPMFLNSTEDLLRSDDELLASFEGLIRNLFPPFIPNEAYTTYQQTYFLESYEQLLESQSQLLEKFEKLIPDDPSVTPEQNAINLGLAWLAAQQDRTTGAWNLGFYPVASTAFAILKLAEYEHTTGDKTYHGNVTSGLAYVLNYGFTQNISVQIHDGRNDNPDTNGNGIGIYFSSTLGLSYGSRLPYETGIVMMALEALGECGFIDPSATISSGSIANGARTYRGAMEDMMNYLAWAQCDSGNGRGGWRYGPFDNAGGDSDNSVSQWAVLGLMSASAWGINAPDWVKSELLNYWLVHSQALAGGVYGGFGYTDNSSLNVGRTAAGLTELTYCGVPTTDPRWIGASSYIGTNWAQPLGLEDGNIGNFYAMYGVMKAAMTAQPAVTWTFGNHTWQEEYDDYLVNVSQVKPNGYWPAQWDSTHVLSTEWALLILEKIAPTPLPSFKESLEDLLRRQSDRIKSFENLLWLLAAPNRTSELMESVENLTREQEGLLKSFEGMVNASSPDFINLLNSTENLLHKQYDIKESFMDMLNETKPYLQADFTMFLSSTEDLLRSDAQLVANFEVLVAELFNLSSATVDTRIYFLESYEQLLESQSQLISKFEVLSGDAQADVAVIKVDVSPTTVLSGDLVNITVSVQDPGGFAETSNVTVYAGSQVIGVQSVYLDSGSSTNLAFTWDTTGFAQGDYVISASASIVPGELNIADNTMLANKVVTILILSHDVAITNVTTSKTIVGQGYSLNVTVTVADLGDYAETFNVTVYANTTPIASQNVTLSSGASAAIIFTWNTNGFAYGNYTISAYAWPVPSEISIADNSFTGGTVKVTIPGDINGDGTVDIYDAIIQAGAINSQPGSTKWNPNADLNDDGIVDIYDAIILAGHFGQHNP